VQPDTDPLLVEWASRIRDAREALSLTQPELGRLVGVTSKTVGEWERQVSLPSRKHRQRLEDIFQAAKASEAA